MSELKATHQHIIISRTTSPDNYSQINQLDQNLESELQDLKNNIGTAIAAAASHQQQPPPQSNRNNSDKKELTVVNFDELFDRSTTPPSSKLEESGWTQNTSSSTSTVGVKEYDLQRLHDLQRQAQCSNSNGQRGVDSKKKSSINHHPLHHQQYSFDNNSHTTNNKLPLHEHQQQLLSNNLSTSLTTLHSSTQAAIQMSYVEQEHLSNDIITMQLRISYLKRKIGCARQVLTAKGGDDIMGDELLRLSLVKEVDLVEQEEARGGGGNDDEKDFEVAYESFKPTNGIKPTRRGSLDSQHSRRGSCDEESDASASIGSIFRITFGGADGMPSRWRAREVEREKQCELDEKKKAKDDAGGGGGGDGASTAENNTKEELLTTLKQLVNERESEISFLEKVMMTVETEKSSLEKDISMLTNTMERTQLETKNEQEKLRGVLDLCQLDNRRLEKELLETSVSLDVKKMNIELLGNELHEARNTFSGRMDREKKSLRRRGLRNGDGPSSTTNAEPYNPQSNQSSKKVASHAVSHHQDSGEDSGERKLLANKDVGERKLGSARSTTSLSNSGTTAESAVTVMSALTTDFGDLVDVLEGINYSS